MEAKFMIDQIKSLCNSKSEEDKKTCIPLLEKYLEQNPADAEAWYDLARCHDFIGDEKAAEPCYQKCYEMGWQKLPLKEQSSFFVGYGSTLRNNLKFTESVKILQEGVSHFPGYPALSCFLAFSYYSNKQDREATETLFASLKDSLAQGFDGYEKAIEWYAEHLKDHPPALSTTQNHKVDLSEGEIIYANRKYLQSFYETLDVVAREKIYIEMIEAPGFTRILDFFNTHSAKNWPAYYAIENDKVVGWADITPSSNPRTKHRGGLGMGLLSSHRGKGLGSKLLLKCLEHAKLIGIEKVELSVYTTNINAIKLYKKMGFTEEGTIKNYRKLDGQSFDCLLMGKFL